MIPRKRFEKILITGKLQEELLFFLEKNRWNAYTRKELAKKFKTTVHRITDSLRLLKQKKVVEHKNPYWIFKKKR